MSSNVFLPSHTDKKRSRLIRPTSLLIYLFVVGVIFFASRFVITSPEILGYASNINVNTLLNLTNEVREKNGAGKLIINSKLSKAAENKAKDMFEDDYWAHTAPDGKEPWDFIKAQDYYYVFAGENLAVDFGDSEDVVRAWMNSPTHKDNLLNANYTEIGFAVVNGELQGRKTTLVVQMFGKPRYTQPSTASTSTQKPATEVAYIPELIEQTEEVSQTVESTETINQTVPIIETQQVEVFEEISAGAVLNSSDVFNYSRFISLVLGLFVTILFAVDGIYVRKHGLFRVTGHTFVHVLFLILAIVGIWYTNIGLVL